jgi:transcriptional regulator with XRE-family HTH domain
VVKFAEILRLRRREVGLSQAALAAAAGVDPRQIRRYEAGEQEPVLPVAVAIADALKISVDALVGVRDREIGLDGDWSLAGRDDGDPTAAIVVQAVRIRQRGENLAIQSLDGASMWRGEFRLWENRHLTGWYAATEAQSASKGVLFLQVDRETWTMRGRWVGVDPAGEESTGRCTAARTPHAARDVLATWIPNRPHP